MNTRKNKKIEIYDRKHYKLLSTNRIHGRSLHLFNDIDFNKLEYAINRKRYMKIKKEIDDYIYYYGEIKYNSVIYDRSTTHEYENRFLNHPWMGDL